TSTLLRRSYREGGRVKKQTLANLSHLDAGLIELIRGWLRGERYVERHAAFQTERSLPAGHVNAVLAMARKLDLARLLDREPSREGKRGTLQIIYGLLCDRAGRPIAVEVFEGSLHDDKTLPSQVEKLTARFRLSEIVVVADRGMITKANIEALRATEGVGWITALKAPQVKKLVKDGDL